ncbi:hypothetical protein DU19_0918 [Chlamydia muridarum]|nr:hypothetical protein DU17_0920 [Chlamydia muridarum]KDU81859.1 hypothetical protein DU18_0919 [Chlamydia muridarum]KDU82064.1 hypothetical protein DU19_0918 [Chlamydia muridarum]KDU83813.1 hypothetical protein DU20_0918 [Chlamydia muridarum]KDU84574.1 hypothetical protein DU21_0920 [Chlamydia muridarum]
MAKNEVLEADTSVVTRVCIFLKLLEQTHLNRANTYESMDQNFSASSPH